MTLAAHDQGGVMTHRIGRQLGRRGAMLLTLGLTYIALGYGVWTRPTVWVEGSLVTYLPAVVPAAGWALSGVVACVAAWRGRDTIGWPALYVLPALYLLSYAGSWLLWVITSYLIPREPPFGDPLAWYLALLRVPFIAIVLICSGWRERQVGSTL